MFYDQSDFDIRCEWGEVGVRQLAPLCDVVVIVDVLSYSTVVDVGVSRGAIIYPYRWKDESAAAYAREKRAVLAGPRKAGGYSLSPASLLGIPVGTRLVLPSPNGATLTLATEGKPTLCGGPRNARAVAQWAQTLGRRILVVPAGERWPDHSLRPAIEDLIGAGAIISRFVAGGRSPEAQAAAAAFEAARGDLRGVLARCSSGKQLIEAGFAQDVEMAAMLDVSDAVPVFDGEAYVNTISAGR